ncbi:vanadium-dependent haloperoxidase [Paractinoplanes atraurantiacus]|uniref:PAP2 superfamily protein n=1 Tax=Paractinoplanes atraurantiacus TaxID=1036182 RepID=A0A285JW24_9ACTN|nr:vanadium-dependent haloperoxidase [Actinoplanes atraurantiacus]SNY64243.1 PAP2 superfamily protein [Actinoplanes atraurantiacus]
MIRRVIVVAALALSSCTAIAAGKPGPEPNMVVTWAEHSHTAAYEVARQPPYINGRVFAMVQGAVYDAANAAAGSPYEPYLLPVHQRRGHSLDAAVATAAYRVLLSIFPEQAATLGAQYGASLATVRDGRAKRGGIALGEEAAAAMIAARRGDGSDRVATWDVGTEPGQWRPTPPGFAQEGAHVADVRPFVIRSGADFRTAGPPALGSAAYAEDLNEVKALGSATSTVRTQDQTESAIWWHDRRQTEWQIKAQLAETQHLSPLRTARMYAMSDVTRADVTIACFTQKRRWGFWRPVTAVQLADTDGNPATSADPAWTPLLITPPFPDFTSGHACTTGAIMLALRRFFGRDDIPFSAYSADSGTTRHFSSFSQATAEVIEARVWGGVHFRSADVQGVDLGEQVTRYVLAREFQPR